MFYSDIDDYYDDMYSYHDTPIRPKWDEKTIQVARDLAGDPLYSRKTISQFQNAFSTYDLNLLEKFFMIVGYDPSLMNNLQTLKAYFITVHYFHLYVMFIFSQ